MAPMFLGRSMTLVPSTSLWQFETPLFRVTRVDEDSWSVKTVSGAREFHARHDAEAEVVVLIGQSVELLTSIIDSPDCDMQDATALAIAERLGMDPSEIVGR